MKLSVDRDGEQIERAGLCSRYLFCPPGRERLCRKWVDYYRQTLSCDTTVFNTLVLWNVMLYIPDVCIRVLWTSDRHGRTNLSLKDLRYDTNSIIYAQNNPEYGVTNIQGPGIRTSALGPVLFQSHLLSSWSCPVPVPVHFATLRKVSQKPVVLTPMTSSRRNVKNFSIQYMKLFDWRCSDHMCWKLWQKV